MMLLIKFLVLLYNYAVPCVPAESSITSYLGPSPALIVYKFVYKPARTL